MENTPLELYIANWAGWTPESDGETPDIRFLPALLRRRLGRLGRMALHAAWKCLHSAGYTTNEAHSLPAIFATRHGDVTRTRQLLGNLARNEELSPTAFSLSVHNSIAGLYSMARKDTATTTVISAGSDTLPQALLEAAGSLTRQSTQEVLLVYADGALPKDYAACLAQPQADMALALLLRADKGPLKLQIGYSAKTTKDNNEVQQRDPANALLNALQNKATAVTCSTDRFLWKFACHG